MTQKLTNRNLLKRKGDTKTTNDRNLFTKQNL